MMKYSVFILPFLMFSCIRSEPAEHEDFQRECEVYYVYDYEVEEENLSGHKVAYLDNEENKDRSDLCGDMYLFYSDSYYTVVRPEHPEKNLDLILKLQDKFFTDSTFLYSFTKSSNKQYSITLKRTLKEEYTYWPQGDTITEMRENTYRWKDIVYEKQNGKWIIKNESFNFFWPKKNEHNSK